MTDNKNSGENKSVAASFKTRSFRAGGFSTLITVIVIAAVIVVNLIVNSLPSAYTKLDTSSNALYSISDETINIVKAIDRDITIYFIAQTNQQDTTIEELLGRYTSLNSRIKVKQIDPAVNPSFTSTYTTETLSASSLIFVSELRSYVVDYNKIYVTEYSDEEIMNYYYYGTTPTGTTSFNGEGAVTGALDYVTSGSIPTIYTLNGHGETSLSDKMAGYIKSDNIISSELSLLTADAVPDDASVLLVNNPTSDISAEEIAKIKAYLDKGGYLILITGFEATGFTNLSALMAENGAQWNEGMIVEGNANYYMSGYPYYLVPKMASSDISALITNTNINLMMPMAHGITKTETLPENVTYNSLLDTSLAAYIKTDLKENDSLEKAEGDAEGQYSVGALLQNSAAGSKIVWFSSPYIVDDNADQYVSGGNSTYFLSTLTYLCEKEASVSIAAKSMQIAALVVDDAASNIWGSIMAIIIPAATLCGGFVYWYNRKKR